MRKTYLSLFALLISLSLVAQEDGFIRKGKWSLETGSSLITGLSSGTGGNIIFSDGSTVTQIGIDIGKFISEDLVIKVKAGILDADGSSIKNFSGGFKYYLGGMAPIEVNAGILSGFGETDFVGEALIGYAAKLADNVYFEPKGGILYSGDLAGAVKLAFVMIL